MAIVFGGIFKGIALNVRNAIQPVGDRGGTGWGANRSHNEFIWSAVVLAFSVM